MRVTYLVAALAAACMAGGVASVGSARAQEGTQFAQACAPGYHADRGGNCQSDVAEVNRYCPPGAVFHPSFDGWYCDAPSGRTYY
jgi:hypothetical protein